MPRRPKTPPAPPTKAPPPPWVLPATGVLPQEVPEHVLASLARSRADREARRPELDRGYLEVLYRAALPMAEAWEHATPEDKQEMDALRQEHDTLEAQWETDDARIRALRVREQKDIVQHRVESQHAAAKARAAGDEAGATAAEAAHARYARQLTAARALLDRFGLDDVHIHLDERRQVISGLIEDNANGVRAAWWRDAARGVQRALDEALGPETLRLELTTTCTYEHVRDDTGKTVSLPKYRA